MSMMRTPDNMPTTHFPANGEPEREFTERSGFDTARTVKIDYTALDTAPIETAAPEASDNIDSTGLADTSRQHPTSLNELRASYPVTPEELERANQHVRIAKVPRHILPQVHREQHRAPVQHPNLIPQIRYQQDHGYTPKSIADVDRELAAKPIGSGEDLRAEAARRGTPSWLQQRPTQR